MRNCIKKPPLQGTKEIHAETSIGRQLTAEEAKMSMNQVKDVEIPPLLCLGTIKPCHLHTDGCPVRQVEGQPCRFSFRCTDSIALDFLKYLRTEVIPIVTSQYDITHACNIKCEGCFYYVGSDHGERPEATDLVAINSFFRTEAERGVNYAEVSGGEPALAQEKLAIMASHIPRGVIYTNGTAPISRDIRYGIQVSIWGMPRDDKKLRGAEIFTKQVRNYRDDDRAVFVFTISHRTVDDILAVTALCADTGIQLTFNHFSPTTEYLNRLAVPHPKRDNYFRFSNNDDNLILTPSDLQRSQDLIAEAMERYPETVIYNPLFNRLIHNPEGFFRLDPVSDVAIDCASRVKGTFKHFRVDLSSGDDVKCATPNISCLHCRCYAQSLGTAMQRQMRVPMQAGLNDWIALWRLWCDLFLPGRHAFTHSASIMRGQ
jgi:hypothetical protein